jgi:siroheme synthase-like protein
MEGEPLLVGLRLAGKRAVVIGDDHSVMRRARDLRRCGADVHVLVDDSETASTLAVQGLRVEARSWQPGDLDGAYLVVLCGRADRAGPLAEARRAGCLVYVPDVPADSDLVMVAVVRRGPLQVGISTSGRSPATARRLAERLESAWQGRSGEILDAVVAAAAAARAELKQLGAPFPPYERWAQAVDAGLGAPNPQEAAAALRAVLTPPEP